MTRISAAQGFDNYGSWLDHYRYMAAQHTNISEWDEFYSNVVTTLMQYKLNPEWGSDPKIGPRLDMRLTAIKQVNTEMQERRRP